MATIISALAGGLLTQRLSLFRALMLFDLLQALSTCRMLGASSDR
ncbi:hypothetical protein [Sodalis sp.]